jgi:Kef-type K+ transport system membrane component KefB/Trk K+ transport system NAD-binding subunit
LAHFADKSLGSGRLLLSSPTLCRPFSPSLHPDQQTRQRGPSPPQAGPDALVALGADVLLFLGATVLVVPLFKSANQSPVLGYLFAGLVMGQLGLFRNVEEIEKLSELGVLFLLFEMGLELSLDKLRSLAKYAFGLGSLQMGVTTAALTAVALPPGEGVMTKVLEFIGSPSELAKIRTVDEAVVIAVALSLSSSAFVLQLLKERNELETKFGSATLGILLFQDIATVPFLILLPLIEGRGSGVDITDGAALLTQLVPTVLKTLGGLGLVLLGGRTFLRRVFEVVASAKSDEVFIALCLLSVTGASLLTQRLGFSDTLGAFVSGVLLSETNFKAQVEADIQPFRGLLLGLFFVTTGASMDLGLCIREWPTVLGLLVGLLALKASVISIIGPAVGLTKAESLRTGFVLSQGGEFAFVLLALAAQLNVLPPELNKLLIIVVVLSMAATPLLTEAGRRVADIISAEDGEALSRSSEGFNLEAPVLVCGFGDVGQAVANMLRALNLPYVAFDLTVSRVQAAQETGFNVLYGDGSRAKVLHAAGIGKPCAVAVGYTARQRSVSAVSSLRNAFPDVPILVRAIDMVHASELEDAGATQVVLAEAEAGLAVGTRIAQDLGAKDGTVAMLAQALREDMAARTHEMALEAAAIANGTEVAGVGASGGSSMRSVYRFDTPRAAWDLPGGSGSSLTGSADDDGTGSGGLLASIFGAMGSAEGSLDVEVTTVIPISSSQQPAVSSSPLTNGNGNGSGGGSGGNEGGSSVVLRKDGDESLVLPDGSIECPVDWEGEVKSNESTSQKDSEKRK